MAANTQSKWRFILSSARQDVAILAQISKWLEERESICILNRVSKQQLQQLK